MANDSSGNSSDFWNDAFNLGLAMYQGRNGSGGTPNFYPVPMTPEEKRWDDERWRVYQAGGSPEMQAARGAAAGYLNQIPSGPTNFNFVSPMFQGQQFAGGMQIPHFDFSGYLNRGPSTPSTPWHPGDGLPAGGVDPSTNRPQPQGGGAQEIDRQFPDASTSHDFNNPFGTPNPNALRDYMGGNQPDHMQPGHGDLVGADRHPGPLQTPTAGPGVQASMGRLSSAWNQFREAHPNWAHMSTAALTAALTATTGLPGALVARGIVYLLNRPNNSLPHPTNTYGNVAANAPGTAGNYDLPPIQEVDPNPRTPYTIGFAGDRASQINSDFLNGLSNGAGGFDEGDRMSNGYDFGSNNLY